jgi:hypothetical protein
MLAWKEYNTLHVLTARGENWDTPCTSVLKAMDCDTPCTFTLLVVNRIHPARPYCRWWKGIHPARSMSFILLEYDVEKIIRKCRNTGILECRKKVSPKSAFLPVLNCLSPTSAFRHRSVRYRYCWSRIRPTLPCYGSNYCSQCRLPRGCVNV